MAAKCNILKVKGDRTVSDLTMKKTVTATATGSGRFGSVTAADVNFKVPCI